MAKHEISIAVKAARAQISAAQRRAGGPGGIPVPGAPASAGRSNQDVRRLTMAVERSTKMERRTQNLMQRQNRLTERLIRQMRTLKTAMSRGGGMGGGTGGGMSGLNLRSSIPIVGFAAAAITSLIKIAVSAGRASMGAVTQQAETAGLAGFQRKGVGTFGPAEIGRFESERRTAAGGFGRRGRGEQQTMALDYARKVGQDPAEAARTVGLFETQGGGFVKSLARMRKEGVDVSQFRTIFQELVPALEEAVAGGVSRSGLASDMAKQIATLSRYFPGAVGARAAAATVRNFSGLGAQVSKGNFESMPGMLLMKAAQRVAERPGALKGLTKEGGLFGGMETGELRKLMARDPITRNIVAQQLARDPESQLEMMRGLRKRFERSMTGVPEKARNARMTRMAQGMGLLPGETTLEQGAALFKQSGAVPGKVGAEDIKKTGEELKMGKSSLRTALGHRVAKEEQLINVAAKLMPGVVALDKAMMALAQKGSNLAPAFNTLGTVVYKAAKSINSLLDFLAKKENKYERKEGEGYWEWYKRYLRQISGK